jgi:hypothetical protein
VSRDLSTIRRAAALACGAVLIGLGGCQFGALRSNLETFNQNGFLRGMVTMPDDASGPIVVFAVPGHGSGEVAAVWTVLARPGPYFLVVPVGTYRVGVLRARAHKRSRSGETVAHGCRQRGVERRVGGHEHAGRHDLGLLSGQPCGKRLELLAAGARRTEVDSLPAGRVGEIATIDDRASPAANARIGLWRPVEFLADVGAGIYFLEPYDPTHAGALRPRCDGPSGELPHPDRQPRQTRYQAWVAYYPAVRLDVASAAIGRWLQALEGPSRFPRLGLIGHSMGGLVARAFLNGDRDGLGQRARARSPSRRSHALAGTLGGGARRRAPVVAPNHGSTWRPTAPFSPRSSPRRRRAATTASTSPTAGASGAARPNDGVVASRVSSICARKSRRDG